MYILLFHKSIGLKTLTPILYRYWKLANIACYLTETFNKNSLENGFENSLDKQLVLAIKQNDPLAFDQLFHKYSKPLYAFVLSILRNESEAEEVVQSVFFKVWEKRKDLNPSLSFKSYLFTIALNATKKIYREKLRDEKYKQELAIELNANTTSDLSLVEYQDLLDYVDKIIDQLPPARRKIFILSKKEGLKNSEIAEQLHVSEQTVKNQLVTAKSFLQSEAKKNGNEFGFLFFLFIERI